MSESEFLLVSPNNYERSSPIFGPQKIIGYFSLDCERNYHGDFRGMKYVKNLKDEEVNYDLNLMMDEKIGKGEYNEKLSKLLNFLLINETRLNFSHGLTLKNVRFCTFRGTLSSICKIPYERIEDGRIVSKLYKGNIYLCQLPTEAKLKKIQNETERDRQMTSWGHKFEQFMTSDSPNSEPDLSQPCVETEEFNIIYQTFLNDHELVFGAENDGIACEGDVAKPDANMEMEQVIEYLNSKTLIELKTSKKIEKKSQEFSFRKHKTLKWWIQSYLAGTNKIICGYRDDNGIVSQLKSYSLSDIMKQGLWSPNVCLNFLDSFLSFVKLCYEKEIIKKNGVMGLQDIQNLPTMSLTFEWKPQHPVRVTDYDDDILPEWFTNNYGKHHDKQCTQDVDAQNNKSGLDGDRNRRGSTQGVGQRPDRDGAQGHGYRQNRQERYRTQDRYNRHRPNITGQYWNEHRQSPRRYREYGQNVNDNRRGVDSDRFNYRYGRSFNRNRRGRDR